MKTHINIHHSTGTSDNQFASINASHKKRFGEGVKSKLGFYGGYHYLVERTGEVKKYRGEEEAGAHNNIDNMNFVAIGVCFGGNMETQEPTKAQLKAAYDLIKDIQKRHKIPDQNVKGHKAYKATACPGKFFGSNPWGTIQLLVEKDLNKDPEWFKATREYWKDLIDVDGFIKDFSPYRTLEAIRKVIENDKI